MKNNYFLKIAVIAFCLTLATAPTAQAMQEVKQLDAARKTSRRVNRCLQISTAVGALWTWYQAYNFFVPEEEPLLYKFMLGSSIASQTTFAGLTAYLYGNHRTSTHYNARQNNILRTICAKLTSKELDIAQVPIKKLWSLFEQAIKENDPKALAVIQPRCVEIPDGTAKVVKLYKQELQEKEIGLSPLLITSLKYFPGALLDAYVTKSIPYVLETKLYKEMVDEGLLAAGCSAPTEILTLIADYR